MCGRELAPSGCPVHVPGEWHEWQSSYPRVLCPAHVRSIWEPPLGLRAESSQRAHIRRADFLRFPQRKQYSRRSLRPEEVLGLQPKERPWQEMRLFSGSPMASPWRGDLPFWLNTFSYQGVGKWVAGSGSSGFLLIHPDLFTGKAVLFAGTRR